VRKIGVVAKPHHPRAKEVVSGLLIWCAEMNIEVLLDEPTAITIGNLGGVTRSELLRQADMAIVLGGDGTLLSLARENCVPQIPLLPVNLGSLGFLTVITLDDLFIALDQIRTGHFDVINRMMLDVSIIRDQERIVTATVFNDAVINKAAIARIIDLATYVDDSYVTTYKADGLIISSPSGSTAYSLSAGGPIVHYAIPALILTPICPHTLTNRPLVVSSKSTVRVTLKSIGAEVVLTLDGQSDHSLKYDDTVEIQQSKHHVPLIQFPSYDYFAILRTKLHWGER